jgi:hypothetical protein
MERAKPENFFKRHHPINIKKTMKNAIRLILLVFLSTNVMSQDRIPLVTDHYHLKLSFDFANQTMQASCAMTIINQSDATVKQVPVILYRLLNVESVFKSGRQGLCHLNKP